MAREDSDGGELEGGLTGVQEDEEGASSASAAAASDRRGDARLLLRDGDGRHMLAATICICLPPTARSAAPNPAAARAQVAEQRVDALGARNNIAARGADAGAGALEMLRLAPRRAVWVVQRNQHQHAHADLSTIAVAVAVADAVDGGRQGNSCGPAFWLHFWAEV